MRSQYQIRRKKPKDNSSNCRKREIARGRGKIKELKKHMKSQGHAGYLCLNVLVIYSFWNVQQVVQRVFQFENNVLVNKSRVSPH
jgi:hypothetical protein